MLRRLREPGKPSAFWAGLALSAGALSLVPLTAPIAATAAALLSLIAIFLCSRYPEKHTGRTKILVALGLCLLGMTLFFAEGALFWRWKISQSYEQRLAVTHLRLDQVAQAMEQYRQEKGAYPMIDGIMTARSELEPKFASHFPVLDGFDEAISVTSRPEGFLVVASPPPPPGSHVSPPPIVAEGGFQPAPAPAPPAPLEEAPPPGATSSIAPEPTAPNPAAPAPTVPMPEAKTPQ